MKQLQSPKLIYFILVVAWLLRAGYALREPVDERDANVYRAIATNLVGGRGYSQNGTSPESEYAPVAPLLLAGVYALGGGNVAARELWAILGVLGVALAFQLARQRHGLVAGNLAAIGMAVYPYNLLMGGSTGTETPNILLILCTLIFVDRWFRHGDWRNAAFAGLTHGVAILTRPAALAFIPLLVVFFFGWPRIVALHERLRAAIVFVLVAVAVVLPWSIRISHIVGKPSITSSAGPLNLWWGMNPYIQSYFEGKITGEQFNAHIFGVVPDPSLPSAEKDKYYGQAFNDFWQKDPKGFVSLLAYKAVKFWQIPGVTTLKTEPKSPRYRWAVYAIGFVSYVPLAILGVLGIVDFTRRRAFGHLALYLSWIFWAMAVNVWFTAIIRYRFATAVDALLILIAAAFLARFTDEHA